MEAGFEWMVVFNERWCCDGRWFWMLGGFRWRGFWMKRGIGWKYVLNEGWLLMKVVLDKG